MLPFPRGIVGEVQRSAPALEYFLMKVEYATYTFPVASVAVSDTEVVGAPAATIALFQVVSLPPAVAAAAEVALTV